jgi:hypothetical protein
VRDRESDRRGLRAQLGFERCAAARQRAMPGASASACGERARSLARWSSHADEAAR